MNIFSDLFKEYGRLAERADLAFSEMKKGYGAAISCGPGCSDCCHSVFGLFLIESAYINYQIGKAGRKIRRELAPRLDRADREMMEVENRLRAYDHDPRLKALAMARERVRCPLLGRNEKCLIYSHRPLTCRVYGIPAITGGEVRTCWKAGFEKGRSYPAFDLDGAYSEMHGLSKKLLARVGQKDMERASLLLSVSRSVRGPLEDLCR